MRRSVFLSFCGIHAITVMNNRGRLKTDLNMGVASKETTCTVYMICIYVEIYGASACFFTRTQFKLQRRRAPRFDLPSQVNELTVHINDISENQFVLGFEKNELKRHFESAFQNADSIFAK